MGQDVNFDGIAAAFEDEIYGSAKGRIRLAVLWRDLLDGIPALERGGLRVLDAGGGAGHIAIRLARLGNNVVLADPSQDMLDRAQEAISQAQLPGQITTLHAGIGELPAALASAEPFDVITCHAVLEWLASPREAIATLASLLGPGGLLSLMFYNRNASLLKRALAGNFPQALRELQHAASRRGWKDGAMPLAEEAVGGWLTEHGLTIRAKAGIRIFHDHIHHGAPADGQLEDLLALEQAARHAGPFASLGQHTHLIAQSVPLAGPVRRRLAFPDPPLAADGVTLRALTGDDLPWITAACSDPDMNRSSPAIPYPFTGAHADAFAAHAAQGWADGTTATFVIAQAPGGDGLGIIEAGLDLADPGRAETGYWLRREARGRGAATIALRLISGWAFQALGIQRLDLTTDPQNTASQRVAERAGFTREGLLRAWLPVANGRRDSLMYSLLPGDAPASPDRTANGFGHRT